MEIFLILTVPLMGTVGLISTRSGVRLFEKPFKLVQVSRPMGEEEVMGTADFLPVLNDGQYTGGTGGCQTLTALLLLSLADVLGIRSEALCRRHYAVDVNGETFWTDGTWYDLRDGLPGWNFRGFVYIVISRWLSATRALPGARTDRNARRNFGFLAWVVVGRVVPEVGSLEGSSRSRMGAV